MPDFRAQRLNMVESQVRTNDVTDVRIQDAMREVPRERFVPSAKQALAYADTVVEVVPGRFLLDPRTFSKLAELAEIEPTDRILDVGCASGYSAAVLARLAHEVIGLEEDAELVRVATDLLLPWGSAHASRRASSRTATRLARLTMSFSSTAPSKNCPRRWKNSWPKAEGWWLSFALARRVEAICSYANMAVPAAAPISMPQCRYSPASPGRSLSSFEFFYPVTRCRPFLLALT